MGAALAFVMSAAGRKIVMYGGAVLAVLFVLMGFYRAGAKAATSAATARTLNRTLKNIKTREDVDEEVANLDDTGSGTPAADELRGAWSRD